MPDDTIQKQLNQVEVRNLTMTYDNYVVQKNISFTVNQGEIFIIMGDSGCGKSTLLRHMIGLKKPFEGDVLYNDESYWTADPEQRKKMQLQFGVLYQSGALWSSMTLAENISVPIQRYTSLDQQQIAEIVILKLSLVGLAGFEGYYPSQISGGMRKRAGLARAMALDPEILLFDEPSAGLDPISSKSLDDLILELRDSMNTTFIIVTHELPSLLGIGDKAIFLDATSKTMIAYGKPKELLTTSKNKKVIKFLTRST